MAKILVRATRVGFFGHKRIKEGQVFELADLEVKKMELDPKTKKKKEVKFVYKADEQFSPEWMEKVSETEAKAEKQAPVKFDQNDNVEVI